MPLYEDSIAPKSSSLSITSTWGDPAYSNIPSRTDNMFNPSSSQVKIPKCGVCGCVEHERGYIGCPMVESVEFFENGQIKSIKKNCAWFTQPNITMVAGDIKAVDDNGDEIVIIP